MQLRVHGLHISIPQRIQHSFKSLRKEYDYIAIRPHKVGVVTTSFMQPLLDVVPWTQNEYKQMIYAYHMSS